MPPSKESGALTELFKEISRLFPDDGNVELQRAVYDRVHEAASEASGVSYEDVVVAHRPCKWIRPEGASPHHVILFMHGGGFSFGSPNGHRKLAAHLAKACNCPALSVDYRRSPEYVFPTAHDDCVAVYRWLLSQGFEAKNVVTAGDSIGGGLATTVAMAAMQNGLPSPGAIVSLSPLYDQTGSGETMTSNEDKDVLNTRPFTELLAKRYAGDTPLDHELLSPIFASSAALKGLPPHWISAAGCDMLLDNGLRMAEKLTEAGVDCVLQVHDGQQHVMEFMAGRAPEADKSIGDIGVWVRKQIGN